ncbi:MAG: calcium-binding protein, partial [Acidobacteriota bacterium]
KGDNDYNDFVFTVYEKEPPKQVVVEAPKAQTITTGNNADTVSISGAAAGNQVQTGWDNDRITLNAVQAVNNVIDAGAGDDTVEGAGSFTGDIVDGGSGNDQITLQGELKNVTVRGGQATSQYLADLDIQLENGGGNDQITVAGTLKGVTVDAGGGNDEIAVVGDAKATTVDAGEGDDVVQVAGRLDASKLRLGSGNDVAVLEAALADTEIDLGGGDDQIVFRGETRNVVVNLGRGGDAVFLDAAWRGDITLRDDKRARQKKEKVTDYDQLILQGPGWQKVDKNTYEKRVDGEVVGTVNLDGNRKNIELIRTDGDAAETFQQIKPKKKRSFFGGLLNFALGAISVIAPPVGLAISAVKTGVDILSGKIKGFGNILKSVAGTAASAIGGGVGATISKAVSIGENVVGFIKNPSLDGALNLASSAAAATSKTGASVAKAVRTGVNLATGKLQDLGTAIAAVGSSVADFTRGAAQKTVRTVTDVASKAVGFIDKPSVSGGLGLLASGAAATGNPVTSQVASGLGAVARGQETGDWRSAGAGVASSVKTIEGIDAARTARIEAEQAAARMARERAILGDGFTESVKDLFRDPKVKQALGRPELDVKEWDDPSLRAGDWVRTPQNTVGVLRESGRVDVVDPLTGKTVEMDFSLLADGVRTPGSSTSASFEVAQVFPPATRDWSPYFDDRQLQPLNRLGGFRGEYDASALPSGLAGVLRAAFFRISRLGSGDDQLALWDAVREPSEVLDAIYAVTGLEGDPNRLTQNDLQMLLAMPQL